MIYALSWYLDVVSPGWGGLVQKSGEGYHAVVPLPMTQKWGIPFLRQPLFAQQLGFFGEPGALAPDWPALFAALQKQAKLVAHYSFNVANTPTLQAHLAGQPTVGWEIAHTHHLDLSPGYAYLRAHYSRDRLNNLRRAERANLTLVESDDLEPLLAMFAQSVAPGFAGGIHLQSYAWLRAIHAGLRARGLAQLWYAAGPNGQLGAGILLARSGNQLIYLFNAAYNHARRDNGRTWLLDQAFRQYAGQPLVFDFESPQVADIASFYRSFGATEVPFCRVAYNNLPNWVRAAWWLKKRWGR
jgi:hypothetical protein